MMNFKSQIERDITEVFHNSAEHADVKEFYYDGKRYKIPVVIDSAEAKDRKKPSTDNAGGIFLVDMIMYVAFSDLQVMPRKGQSIEFDDDIYTIVSVQNETGEIAIHLEMLDE